MYRYRISAATILLWALSSSIAQAEEKKEPPKLPPALAALIQGSAAKFIKRFDKNGDGYLTKDELPPRLKPFFERMDTNSDGKLDTKEVEAMLQVLRKRFGENAKVAAKTDNQPDLERQVADLLKRLDTNKDGKISREEAKGPLAKNFDRLDTNKDGYLDKEELRRAMKQFAAAKGNAKDKGAGRPAGQQNTLADFDALDRNADGRLTRDELKGTPFAEVFDQIDTNKDGKIDRKEFEAYLKKQAEKKASSAQ